MGRCRAEIGVPLTSLLAGRLNCRQRATASCTLDTAHPRADSSHSCPAARHARNLVATLPATINYHVTTASHSCLRCCHRAKSLGVHGAVTRNSV